MAQYIQAPAFSYDPLPMEQYVQFAKEQALAYETTLNQAYQFLDKLPILDGGLRTEGWAQQLRQEYGSEVQNAIDNFVASKDRRALARELSNISTRLRTDNDILVNNYDARAAAPTMQLFQTQPNGANSFTKSGTMTPVARVYDPITGELKREENNFIQFQRGQTTIQDAERSYNDYVGAYNIIDDTKFMTEALFNNIQTVIGSKIIQDPSQPGVLMIQTDTGIKKYNNMLDLIRDPDAMDEYYQASKAALDQLEVQWDQNQSNTVRAYKYRGLSFQDYLNDAFATTMPKLHAYDQVANVTSKTNTGAGKANTAANLAEILVDTTLDPKETAELSYAQYMDPSDIVTFRRLNKAFKEQGYTLQDVMSGNIPESADFIELSERIATREMLDLQLNDPVTREAIQQAFIEYDASGKATNHTLRTFAAENPGVNGDVAEELFKFFSSSGMNLGLYGQEELFGMELEQYDFTRVSEWADQYDPFIIMYDSGARTGRKASPVAVQTEIIREGLKNFGPGMDGALPIMTPESYDLMLEAKAAGAEDITNVAEVNRQAYASLQNPLMYMFGDENIAVVRENLTYDQMEERGLIPQPIQEIFETHGDEIRYGASSFGDPEALYEFTEERNAANTVKSQILSEANKFEVYTPKTILSPAANIRGTIDDRLKNTVIKQLSTGTDLGVSYDIYVVDRDPDNAITYGPESLTGSGYNYMRKITPLAEDGGLSSIFYGTGGDQKGAEFYLEGALAGVGAGQKSGLLLSINVRDNDDVADALSPYFSPGKSTNLFIVPKSNAAKEDAFGWISDYRSQLTTKAASGYSQTGLFGSGFQSGEQMEQLMDLGNKLNVFNTTMPLNSQAAMKRAGIPITNGYVDSDMGFVVSFDTYRPDGNMDPAGAQLSEVYRAYHESGDYSAWTWEEYFSNRIDESQIMLEEALLAANSQQLSEDYSQEEITDLRKLIADAAYVNSKGHQVLNLGTFKDLFQRAGVAYNFNKGIVFPNKYDLATFTSMLNPEAALD